MTPRITFGDNVRLRSTPETEALGVAGQVGQVFGETTPSVTGVAVTGQLVGDYALNVHFEGRTDTLWFAVAYAFGFVVVALLSIKKGEGGFDFTDLICLIGAAVSAWLWWEYNSPETALFATLTIDALGMIPTLSKSWKRPDGENHLAWVMTMIAALLNVLALNWSSATFAIALYPLYMLSVSILIVGVLYRGRSKIRARRTV